jgi:hypothetical protein
MGEQGSWTLWGWGVKHRQKLNATERGQDKAVATIRAQALMTLRAPQKGQDWREIQPQRQVWWKK